MKRIVKLMASILIVISLCATITGCAKAKISEADVASRIEEKYSSTLIYGCEAQNVRLVTTNEKNGDEPIPDGDGKIKYTCLYELDVTLANGKSSHQTGLSCSVVDDTTKTGTDRITVSGINTKGISLK